MLTLPSRVADVIFERGERGRRRDGQRGENDGDDEGGPRPGGDGGHRGPTYRRAPIGSKVQGICQRAGGRTGHHAHPTLSYANVTASLALFVALAGTATAAVTLPRDSVAARQIRADAVRSPEIAKDAVRSPEIRAGAVRSPELEDGGVRLEDIAGGARDALAGAEGPRGPAGPPGTSRVRILEADAVTVPGCDEFSARSCSALASMSPGLSDALVTAKFSLSGTFGLRTSCALTQGLLEQTTLDEASQLGLDVDFGNEQVTLTAVAGPTGFVSVRCTEEDGSALTVNDLKLTALAVDDVTRF